MQTIQRNEKTKYQPKELPEKSLKVAEQELSKIRAILARMQNNYVPRRTQWQYEN